MIGYALGFILDTLLSIINKSLGYHQTSNESHV